MIDHLWQEIVAHKALLAGLSIGFSVALVVASVVGLPWYVARLPVNYFCGVLSERAPQQRSGPLKVAARIGRNLIGGMLALVGLAMIVLPGQGVVTILVALTLLDFPGKRRLERWLIQREPLRRGLNWLRERAGKPPFEWEQSV